MGTKPARLLIDSNTDASTTKDILRGLQLPNGTRKTTWPNRFTELNARCIEHLGGVSSPLRVLDIAVSSGISTIELVDAITSAGIATTVTATDLFTHGDLVKVFPGVNLLVDNDDRPIQWEFLGRTLRAHPNGSRIDHIRRALNEMWTRLPQSRKRRRQVIPLVDSRLEKIATVIREDLFNPDPRLDGPYDLVRACNILNLDYFTTDELTQLTRTLINRLAADGLLVIARTRPDETNYASIYRRMHNGRLEVLEHINSPCDVHEICMEATN